MGLGAKSIRPRFFQALRPILSWKHHPGPSGLRFLRTPGTGQPPALGIYYPKMKRTTSKLIALLLSVFLPGAGHTFRVVTPVIAGSGSGAGSSAAGAATGSYGSQTNVSVQPVLTGTVGQTTLINVNTPSVQVIPRADRPPWRFRRT